MKNVLFVGDIHGEFGILNLLINKKNPDIVIQCGDNAYFWLKQQAIEKIKPQNSIVYLLPGNHEDWEVFESYIGRRNTQVIEVEKNIFYCPIGSSITVNDKKILFIGGADSIDKDHRMLGRDWFAQEVMNHADVEYILDNYNSVDIVASHTCPYSFAIKGLQYEGKLLDQTRLALDAILKNLGPSEWYFGHWHQWMQGQYKGCRWWGLDHVESKQGRSFIMRVI